MLAPIRALFRDYPSGLTVRREATPYLTLYAVFPVRCAGLFAGVAASSAARTSSVIAWAYFVVAFIALPR